MATRIHVRSELRLRIVLTGGGVPLDHRQDRSEHTRRDRIIIRVDTAAAAAAPARVSAVGVGGSVRAADSLSHEL